MVGAVAASERLGHSVLGCTRYKGYEEWLTRFVSLPTEAIADCNARSVKRQRRIGERIAAAGTSHCGHCMRALHALGILGQQNVRSWVCWPCLVSFVSEFYSKGLVGVAATSRREHYSEIFNSSMMP